MRAYLVPVLCGALVLQGAFAASLERRSPVMTEGVESQSQGWYRPEMSSLIIDSHSPGMGHGGEGSGEGGDDPNGGGNKVGTGEGNKRRSVTQATSDLIGVESQSQGWYRPEMSSLIIDSHSPGMGHGGEGNGEGGDDPNGGGNKVGTGEGNKRRSVTLTSSDLITSEAEINHDEGHGDGRHTRQSEAPIFPSMPRPSH